MKRYIVGLVVLSLVSSMLLGFASVSFAQKKYKEAPMLAELVKQGKLPPVEERLPQNPFVVGPGVLISKKDLPDWNVGKYGGALKFVHVSADWSPDVFIANCTENLLVAPGIGIKDIKPNIVDKFNVSKDNRVFTFHLREGLKWSDGEPVTTEDIRFTYEDVLLNDKITPVFPAKFRSAGKPDGEPMKLEILDKYSFRISFKEPYGGFLREITVKGWSGYTDLIKPAHYLRQFHIKYTSIEKLKPLLEKEGLKDEWWQLFNLKDFSNWEQTQASSIGFPVLTPWRLVKASGGIYEWERNPYYFKVDTAGNQLPYIDKLISIQVQDAEMANMKVLTGEVNFLRESTALIKLPLYKQNEKKAGYRTHLLDMHVDPSCLWLNPTYKDPTWRKVVRDIRFRRALNMAINRKEIIDSVYYGLASLPKTVPNEYNPAKAEQLLDEIGMKKGPDGWRLGPDGKVFEILIECGAQAPDLMPVGELLVEHFKRIGIKTMLKRLDPSLLGQRLAANEVQGYIIWNPQPQWRDMTSPQITYLPCNNWAPEWANWYTTGGKTGEEPPSDIKQLYKLHEGRLAATPYSPQDVRLTNEIYKLHYENIYIFPIVEKVKYALITPANLKNVPRSGQAIAANMYLEQSFFEK
ncbi:MAG: ABC transporter substrate-binding protein [archaeon YNP-WB-040]|jgi:peptide/nickel transport system substrate-binding protein|nr:ABC transporter substrate-binding protein [Candidatus Culexarchaeum yellowstonense]